MSILEVKGLKKTYTTRFGGNQVQALKNVSENRTVISISHRTEAKEGRIVPIGKP